ncbi:MAG: cbb3-type cytochrome c oxidase subunit 3 [Proteobacteria bacterium]|nr:cbb3-type cytochrome c oxidase subunit 3 [Pseudomonadota bacterium]
MEALITAAPTLGLLFFFMVFIGIALWTLLPSNKQRLQAYGHIPLKEEPHGNER